jgi:hypothetical protein
VSRTLPDALLRAGLATRLRARRASRIEPPPYDDRRDHETPMLNPKGIAEYTSKLAEHPVRHGAQVVRCSSNRSAKYSRSFIGHISSSHSVIALTDEQ